MLLIVTIIVGSILLSSCSIRNRVIEQTEYHDSIYELEEYLLANMNEYYRIEEPNIDNANKIIDIDFVFIPSYINIGKVDNTVIEVMENTRIAINVFLEENEDYYLNDDYLIRIEFLEAPKTHSLPYETWGRITNRLLNSSSVEDSLCNICYNFRTDDLQNESITFQGIREIDVQNMLNTDFILEIIDRIPNLEIVHVNPEYIQYFSEIYPDIYFV